MWLRRFFGEKESVIYSASYKGSDFHMSLCAGEKKTKEILGVLMPIKRISFKDGKKSELLGFL